MIHAPLHVLLASSPLLAAFGGAHVTPPLPPPPPPPWHGPGDTIGPSSGGAPSGQPKAGNPTGPSAPKGPAAPTGPATSGPTAGGPGTGTPAATPQPMPGGPGTGGPADAIDPTTWEYWWLYNKDAYLALKSHVEALAPRSGRNAASDAAAEWDQVGERVLPALTKALASARDFDPTLSAMIALARLCDGGARREAGALASLVLARERDPNRVVAEGSILALGILGHEPTVIELCAILRDTPEARRKFGGKSIPSRTRAFAALSLGLLGERTSSEEARRYAVTHLSKQLSETEDARPDTQVACTIALGMIPIAGDDGGGAAGKLARELPASGSLAGELTLLIDVMEDGAAPPYVRAHLPRALARLAAGTGWSERVTRTLLRAMNDRKEADEVVQGCVLSLGSLADASAAPLDRDVRAALVRQVEDGELQARCFARIALAQIAARGEEGDGVEEARNLLVNGVLRGKSRERTWSALALGVLENGRRAEGGPKQRSVDALCHAISSARSPEDVGAAAIGCGLAGVTAAVPALLEHLRKVKEPRAQGYVGLALGLLEAREALEPLRALLTESRICSEKLPQTALSLALLEDPLLVASLVDLLKKGTSQSTLSAAAAALGTVGDRRAVDPLLALVTDEYNTPATHAAAIAALGRVCDRDRLPWQHAVSAGLNYRALTPTLSDENHSGVLDLR